MPCKGGKQTQEAKNKISIANKGKTSWLKGGHWSLEMHKKMDGHIGWNKGVPRSDETKRKISIALKGQKAEWMLGNTIRRGKKASEETLQKMRIAMEGKKLSEETKLKMSKSRSLEKHYNWKGGISFEPYTVNFDSQLKDRIRVRDNFICQCCGIPELECNEKLSIHHIDHNKQNCSGDNLITLCRKCNTKVNYNREFWVDYFKEKVNK